MPDLEELIRWWEDRLLENPPMTSWDWKETVQATVVYLEELKALKRGY